MSWPWSSNVLLWTGGGNEAPTFAFGPSASALRTAPYQRLELPPDAEASRTAVILAFRDAGDEKRGGWPPDSIQHRDWRNVEFFIRQVVGGKRSLDMDFIFVDTTSGGPAIDLTNLPENVRYVHRDNTGFDMCSFKIGLALLRPGQYRYVVLMNGSVRGPFSTALDFLEPFKRHLSEETPVVGTTVTCLPRVHIQSMFYLVNSLGAKLLNATLSCNINTKNGATWGPHGEINISQNVLAAGYNFAVLQGYWQGHDFRDRNLTAEKCQKMDDPYYPMADRDPETLKEKDVDAEEVIFFKSNRAVNEGRLEWLTQRYDALCGSVRKYQRNIPWEKVDKSLCGTWMVQRNQRGKEYYFLMLLVALLSWVVLGYLFRWRPIRYVCFFKRQANRQ